MTTRREFLQAGIAVPLVAGVFASDQTAADSASAARPTALPLYKAVFDERFPESAAFAAEMQRLGVATHGIAGDMTDLWYYDLHPRWMKTPVPIAGLTAHGPLFCLERLAWDHGMRVTFRAEHRFRPDGCVEHVISADESVLRDAGALRTAGSNWSKHIAGLVNRCGQTRVETRPAIVTALGQPRATEQDPLYSWVISPRARS